MPLVVSSSHLKQGRRNLRGLLNILDLLWLNDRRDITENVEVYRNASGASRQVARRICDHVEATLATVSDEQVAEEEWVEQNQKLATIALKACNNIFSHDRPLPEVSYLPLHPSVLPLPKPSAPTRSRFSLLPLHSSTGPMPLSSRSDSTSHRRRSSPRSRSLAVSTRLCTAM